MNRFASGVQDDQKFKLMAVLAHPDDESLGFGGTLFGGSFNTVVGVIFLAIVLVSPDGLLGLWGRLFDSRYIARWRRTPTLPAGETSQ